MSEKSQEYLKDYKNLLDKNINYMLQPYNPIVPIKKGRRPTPAEVKLRVLQSQKLNRYLDDVSKNKEDRQKKVSEMLQILTEIAFQRKILVIRTLGSVLSKLLNQLYTSVLINERSINSLKASFGNQQVIYLPSHRSYADFMLMSVVCFCYNVEIPAIAAGMDFHGMMGIGEALRKTGAFFMRRKFGENDFYWRLFREYMHEVITFNDQGLEFFIEGTRSRSCKALTPKTGLLSMALEPYFMGEIHNLKIVPISISYEKPLEEQLFVYELLGIPKPKESTLGFFKAITNLKNQNLGKIYFDFCEPITLNEYYGEKSKLNRFAHASEPSFVQTLDPYELNLITELGHDVVRRQQEKIVIMSFNLIALIYNEATFTGNEKNLTFWELERKVLELIYLFEGLGAIVAIDTKNLEKDIKETILIHQNILQVKGSNSNLKMIRSNVDLSNINASKLKGIALCDEVMNVAIPVVSLQLYCNPTLFWLVEPSFIILSLLEENEISIKDLKENVGKLRQIFIHEFVLYPGFSDDDFNQTLDNMISLEILHKTNHETIELNSYSKYINLLLSAIAPFINSYLNTSRVIFKNLQDKTFVEKDVFIAAQTYLEEEILKGLGNVHPYSLCLDSISLLIFSLCNAGFLLKQKRDCVNHYTINLDNLSSFVEILDNLNSKLPFEYNYFDVNKPSKI